MLELKNCSVLIENKQILKDISLKFPQGTITVCMGPNGSGKSSLFHTIMGHPTYTLSSGFIVYNNQNIAELSVEKRAALGILLLLQQPYEIPGVLVSTLLKESFRALHSKTSMDVYIDRLSEGLTILQMDRGVLDRAVHVGFSGGEKKKLEILQAFILQPKILLIDELDSGLDIDAGYVVGNALKELKKRVPSMTIIMITHSETFLSYLSPDYVHIFDHGSVRKSGDAHLIDEIQKSGYGV